MPGAINSDVKSFEFEMEACVSIRDQEREFLWKIKFMQDYSDIEIGEQKAPDINSLFRHPSVLFNWSYSNHQNQIFFISHKD